MAQPGPGPQAGRQGVGRGAMAPAGHNPRGGRSSAATGRGQLEGHMQQSILICVAFCRARGGVRLLVLRAQAWLDK